MSVPCSSSVGHLLEEQELLIADGLYKVRCAFPCLQMFSVNFSHFISVPTGFSVCIDVSWLRGFSRHKSASVHYASSRLYPSAGQGQSHQTH